MSKLIETKGIQVLEATYGENCRVARGNVTKHIASVCNGKNSCTYTIDYTVIRDPAVSCAKDSIALSYGDGRSLRLK